MFRGIYRSKRVHDNDFQEVLRRATDCGVASMVITGTDLHSSKEALELAIAHGYYSTAGVHPTQSGEFTKNGPEKYFSELKELILSDRKAHQRIKAIGECGLDYDRLHFSDKETQIKYFKLQFELSLQFSELPLFLHDRNTQGDFARILREHRSAFKSGVVHSFTGSMEEMKTYTNEFDLYIGINGCSLKTRENLEVVRQIPLDKLLLETDAPWCEIRPTHAAFEYLNGWQQALPARKKEKFVMGEMVKSRNEPCNIRFSLY
jgi:TatD DNase family protein